MQDTFYDTSRKFCKRKTLKTGVWGDWRNNALAMAFASGLAVDKQAELCQVCLVRLHKELGCITAVCTKMP